MAKKKSYAKHVSIMLGTSAVLALFVYVLVEHHRDIPERVRQDRHALLSIRTTTLAERIKPVGQVDVARNEPLGAAPAAGEAAAPTAAPARDGQQVYQASCIACHGAGIAGAPKVGDRAAWSQRNAKGNAALYASAIKGFQGAAGVMPPKGGNPALSDAEVKAAVDYMVAQSK
jgi:cytochrome c5